VKRASRPTAKSFGPLLTFCKDFLSSNIESWPPSESALAEAFVSQFPVSSFLLRSGVEEVCARLRVDVSFRELPPDLAGFNSGYGGNKEIVLSEMENPLGITTHTFFHEIRELIERIFIDLGHPTIPPGEQEKIAEQFAITVRMNSAYKESESSLGNALEIQSDWLRWGSVAIISGFVLFQAFMHILLPKYEASMSRKN
jgi:hypothetical protein